MNAVGAYLIQVSSVALICSVVRRCFSQKSTFAAILKLITGILMLLSLIRPFMDIRIDMIDKIESFSFRGESVASAGTELARNEMANIINEKISTYILEKAEQLGVEISVSLTLTDDLPPVPASVVIRGSVSPYARKILSQYMDLQLGIATEEQTWISQP